VISKRFTKKVREKGYWLYKNNKVFGVAKHGDFYYGFVEGEDRVHQVGIEVSLLGNVGEMKCDCPDLQKMKTCQHEFAMILYLFGVEKVLGKNVPTLFQKKKMKYCNPYLLRCQI